MDDRQFRQVLDRLGLSWRGYRKVRKGVKKRIRRHMQALKCETFETYLLALDRDEEIRVACERLMTVSISRFFRDLGLWETLENQILPEMIPRNREGLKVWFAGCACGEEVYSFTILWNRLQDRLKSLPELRILATDMNPLYLEKAQIGLFAPSSLRDVTKEARTNYFSPEKEGDRYEIMPSLKRAVSWTAHNLLHDPPDRDFQLIFLRNNLLTYYQTGLKEPAFQKVVDCLAGGGFLIIGSHEKLPLQTVGLVPFEGYAYVFHKEDSNDT